MVKGRFQISNLKFQILDFQFSFPANLARVAVGLATLASSSMAFAQMCPACYQNAAAQAPGLLQAFKTGVLVMIFPTLLMFILIFGVAFRRRNSFYAGDDEVTGSSQDPAHGKISNLAVAPFKA